jgi:Uma2 family endonuclease
MISAGVIPNGAPIELIEGILVHKDRGAPGEKLLTHNPRHAFIIQRLLKLLSEWCEHRAMFVQSQLPVALNEFNAPEPDIAVIVGSSDAHASRHPGPGEVAAVFEVAGSSLEFDTTTKRRLYASAGIPIYSIINFSENQIEVHSQPDSARGIYSERTEYRPGQSVALKLGPDVLDIDSTDLMA